MFIDTHTHMDHKRFDAGRNEIIQQAIADGITMLVNPAIGYETNESIREKLKKYPHVFYGVGIHPKFVGMDDSMDLEWAQGLRHLLCVDRDPKVVAIGETGLDFHCLSRTSSGDLDEEGQIKLGRQMLWFGRQLQLATETNLPLILHIRNAKEEDISESMEGNEIQRIPYMEAHKHALELLMQYQSKLSSSPRGVVHCFTTRDYKDALAYIDLGYMLGIGGAVTYAENAVLQEIVRKVPLQSIVLETDSPYVLPEGIPGKRNSPLNISYIAEYVAKLKGVTVEEVAQVTTDNAIRLFHLSDK